MQRKITYFYYRKVYLILLLCSGAIQFSDCSAQDFEALILRGGGVCLRNQPSGSDVIGIAECGNGYLDKGEECDCGPPEVKKGKIVSIVLCPISVL